MAKEPDETIINLRADVAEAAEIFGIEAVTPAAGKSRLAFLQPPCVIITPPPAPTA